MWRRKWFPWQQREAREERLGEEGEGERGGGVPSGSWGDREAAGQGGRRMGLTERGRGGAGILGLRLKVAVKQGGAGQRPPALPSTKHQGGQSIGASDPKCPQPASQLLTSGLGSSRDPG